MDEQDLQDKSIQLLDFVRATANNGRAGWEPAPQWGIRVPWVVWRTVGVNPRYTTHLFDGLGANLNILSTNGLSANDAVA